MTRATVKSWNEGVFTLGFVALRREEIDWAGLRAAAVAIGILDKTSRLTPHVQVQQTRWAFRRSAQQNAFRHRNVRQQSRSFALRDL